MRTSEDTAKLLLRLLLGILVLFHGVAKLTGGLGPLPGLVERAGLPAGIAWLVLIGEVLAPALLIIGLWTRPAALVVAINMIVALWLVHVPQFFTISKSGGYALELQAMFLFTAIAIALLGAGRYSLGGAQGRWN